MSKQVIIELNQNDVENTEVYGSGDYVTSLKKPVVIEKGDQVQLKSVFLDTRVANSKKIILKGDPLPNGGESDTATITMTIGYYKTDILGTFENIPALKTTNYFEAPIRLQPTETGSFTGKPFPAFFKQTNSINNYINLNSVTFEYVCGRKNIKTFMINIPERNYKTTATFTFAEGWEASTGNVYVTTDKDTGLSKVTLDSSNYQDILLSNGFSSNIKGFPVLIPDPRTLTPPQTIDDTYVKANNTKGDGVISVSTSDYIDGEDIFELYTNKLELKLPRGLYDAENIAELINSKAVSLDYGGVNTSKSYAVTENPLLRTIQQVKIDDNKDLLFFDVSPETDARRFFQYDAGDGTVASINKLNYYIGSSQFGLSYNSSQDKMEFLQLHNSLYNSKFKPSGATEGEGTPTETSRDPEVRIIKNSHYGQQALNKIFVANKNSGIFFTALEPEYLWFDEFKFNRNILVGLEAQLQMFDFGTTPPGGVFQPDLRAVKLNGPANLTEGVTITSDESGVDELITKSLSIGVNRDPNAGGLGDYIAGSASAFDIQRGVTADFPEIVTNVINPQGIVAEEQLGESIKDEGGYFKIEVSMDGVRSDVRGYGENNKIQSIVSKFYSQNSFTSGYNEGSIVYQHNSDEPLVLNDFRVRVLDPNNQLSKSIGDSNAVFLEIVKSD